MQSASKVLTRTLVTNRISRKGWQSVEKDGVTIKVSVNKGSQIEGWTRPRDEDIDRLGEATKLAIEKAPRLPPGTVEVCARFAMLCMHSVIKPLT